MKNSEFYYSVGALLYCPANNKTIVDSIRRQKFGQQFSLALCLEDTIADRYVEEAEAILCQSIRRLHHFSREESFYLPKIFIRVRRPQQIPLLSRTLGDSLGIVTGYIIPSFSPDNADDYIAALADVNERAARPVYMMPIYESAALVDLRSRYDILYALKDKLKAVEDRVLNIRVGGNDLCHIFGFRRHSHESIHQIAPVAGILSDIVTVYGADYVISGPVWEYYQGDGWRAGLLREIADDKLCGFTGKTVIHPNQIATVNEAFRVSQEDLDDAKSILNWDEDAHSLVAANPAGQRMNEYKTHYNWARQTIFTAQAFGVKASQTPGRLD